MVCLSQTSQTISDNFNDADVAWLSRIDSMIDLEIENSHTSTTDYQYLYENAAGTWTSNIGLGSDHKKPNLFNLIELGGAWDKW